MSTLHADNTNHGDVTPELLRHHGDTEATPGLIDLAVNVRRPQPPRWLAEVLRRHIDDLARYPNPTSARHAVARMHGRDINEVLLTAGAAEAFVLISRALKPAHAVVVHPQFTEPEAALTAAGVHVDRLLLDPNDGFQLHPEQVPTSADLVIVGNPTNPTSILHSARAIRQIAKPGRIVVVDEAFMDAVAGPSESLAEDRHTPGMLVLRSLTKTWGLAGLRVGYALGAPDVLGSLSEAQPLWPVSTLALAAAEACCSEQAQHQVRDEATRITADSAYLTRRLDTLPGLVRYGTPRGPFVLTRTPHAHGVREHLRNRGIAVRRGDTFPGLGPDWLRIAVKDRETTDLLVSTLADILIGGDSHLAKAGR
ncbi:MAG: threonine-phosphate decarboxylase [Gordonia polyisoprenivorans]|nr:threonine-phosphate decarboxylase [Gordonia polyisoprenivorans]